MVTTSNCTVYNSQNPHKLEAELKTMALKGGRETECGIAKEVTSASKVHLYYGRVDARVESGASWGAVQYSRKESLRHQTTQHLSESLTHRRYLSHFESNIRTNRKLFLSVANQGFSGGLFFFEKRKGWGNTFRRLMTHKTTWMRKISMHDEHFMISNGMAAKP